MNLLEYYLKCVLFAFFRKEFWKAFLSAVGLVVMICEAVNLFWPEWKIPFSFTFVMVFSVIYASTIVWPRHKVCCQLDGLEVFIELVIGDIFSFEGDLIIGTNTTFDTDMNNNIISASSLQGQFTKKFYDNTDHLNSDIERCLHGLTPEILGDEKIGKKRKYPIGTICKVSPQNKVVYLIAISHVNNHGNAWGEKGFLLRALPAIWTYVGERGRTAPLVIPVLGTGNTRLTAKREEVIWEIIQSFIAASKEKKFTEKLTIVISQTDFHRFKIDFNELRKYVEHVCKYAGPNLNAGLIGTAIP